MKGLREGTHGAGGVHGVPKRQREVATRCDGAQRGRGLERAQDLDRSNARDRKEGRSDENGHEGRAALSTDGKDSAEGCEWSVRVRGRSFIFEVFGEVDGDLCGDLCGLWVVDRFGFVELGVDVLV